jgi:hypothetical protein
MSKWHTNAALLSTLPQNRHPERSSSRTLRAAQSKDPETFDLTDIFCTFFTSNAGASSFVHEKISRPHSLRIFGTCVPATFPYSPRHVGDEKSVYQE